MKYVRAFWSDIGPATVDVIFVAVVSLIPLLLARLTPIIDRREPNLAPGWLWDLLTSGQLAFYALGSLATIALVVYKGESLPAVLRTLFGCLTLIFILFIAYLIGVDPTLANAPHTFVGETSFWLYLFTQIMAVAVVSFQRFSLSEVLKAAGEECERHFHGAGRSERYRRQWLERFNSMPFALFSRSVSYTSEALEAVIYGVSVNTTSAKYRRVATGYTKLLVSRES